MWSSETAYRSAHSVMKSFIEAVEPKEYQHLFLIGEVNHEVLLEPAQTFKSSKKDSKSFFKRHSLRKRWLEKINLFVPDIILVDGLGMARLLMPVLNNYNKARVLVFFHGETSFSNKDIGLFKKSKRLNLKFVAVSKTLAMKLRNNNLDVDIIPIPTFLNLTQKNTLCCSKAKIKNKVILGAVGRLAKEKNFSILIELVQALRDKKYEVCLLVAGEGTQRKLLEQRIVELNLLDKIQLLGMQKDIASFYETVDLLLVPSTQEGLGLIIQEALNFNKPVICSNIAVFQEQLGAGGVYCHPNSLEQWLAAVENYISIEKQKELLSIQKKQYEKYNSYETYKKNCKLVCEM